MKRWAAAVVTGLFLATAAFHGFLHSGISETACVVCHVQQASLPAIAAPSVIVTPAAEALLPECAAPRVLQTRAVAAAARAPPAIPA